MDERELSLQEVIELGAVDTDFFCHHYFPKAFRGPSPSFAPNIWSALDNPLFRLLNLKVFRGGAKTTDLRGYTAKRVAYGVSNTILYIGASEGHATRSVMWLRNQIEPRMGGDGKYRQTAYARDFGLRPGQKWQEHEIEIIQSVMKEDGTSEERVFWVLGVGITGNIRGINFDDYRPDLILLDDVLTDENASTGPQRDKYSDLIMGAVKNSLAPSSEKPNAKIVMLQTPLDPDDASARAERSAEWHTEVFGCWTEETKDFPLDRQESSWPDRYPSETLRAEKTAALIDNRYSIFAKEMECRLVAAETLIFRPNWLRRISSLPKIGTSVIAIDPVPPPSEAQLAKGLKNKDFEAVGVLARARGEYFVMEYATSRGHDPTWTADRVFEYMMRYRPLCVVISMVSAERYLRFFLEKEMARRGRFLPIKEAVIDGKSKFTRIVTALSGLASQGKLFCLPMHSEFILQFESYGMGYRGLDDVLDMVAVGIAELTSPYLELGAEDYEEIEELLGREPVEDFPAQSACP